MSTRLHLILSIGLIMVACEKPRNAEEPTQSGKTNQRLARADRPGDTVSPKSHDGLRASLAETLRLETSEERDSALSEVAREALEIDPMLSAKAIQQMSADYVDKAAFIRTFAIQLAAKDPEGAFAWAAALELPQDVNAAKVEIASVIAQSDPGRAVKDLSRSGFELDDPGGRVANILADWVSKSPSEAADWVQALQAGESRKNAVETVVVKWLHLDSKEAFGWLGKLRNQDLKREATLAAAGVLAGTPEPSREAYYSEVDAATRRELERQVAEITKAEKGTSNEHSEGVAVPTTGHTPPGAESPAGAETPAVPESPPIPETPAIPEAPPVPETPANPDPPASGGIADGNDEAEGGEEMQEGDEGEEMESEE